MEHARKKSERHHVSCRHLLLLLCALGASVVNSFGATTITRTNYHGWPGSYVISNGTVEVIVVPAIGRVMQFRFVGDEIGPFFENRAMDGKHPIPASKEWGNFGGDKTWPSPQDDWPKITPRAWPPPIAFDSMPVEASVDGDSLRLTSKVDPDYGIRTERIITLNAARPLMTITTTYHKVQGEPRKVGVWIITQLKEPDFIYIPTFATNFVRQSDDLPRELRVGKRGISLKRNAAKSSKIGTTASALIWVGGNHELRIVSERQKTGEYPDHGSSAEVYTNPNPLAYVELEMLGPLNTMKVGDTLSQTNRYLLGHRADLDADVSENPK